MNNVTKIRFKTASARELASEFKRLGINHTPFEKWYGVYACFIKSHQLSVISLLILSDKMRLVEPVDIVNS